MAVSGRRVYWNKRQFDNNSSFEPIYKKTRTRKLRKRKPYMWRVMHPEFGLCFTWCNVKPTEHYWLTFRNKHLAYTGWDSDRNRFVVDSHKRITLMMRGTWKYTMWYG